MSYSIYRPAAWSMRVSVQPVIDPIDSDYAFLHTELASGDSLTLMAQYIDEARDLVEKATNRGLLTQTRVLKLDDFPASTKEWIELPGGRLQSITSITYVDADGATQTWSASAYTIDTGSDHWHGRVGLVYDGDWPEVQKAGLPVTITYVVGWEAAADVPPALRGAVAKLAAELYDERGASNFSKKEPSPWFESMISAWRIPWVGA